MDRRRPQCPQGALLADAGADDTDAALRRLWPLGARLLEEHLRGRMGSFTYDVCTEGGGQKMTNFVDFQGGSKKSTTFKDVISHES